MTLYFAIDAEYGDQKVNNVKINKTIYNYITYEKYCYGVYTEYNNSEFYKMIHGDFKDTMEFIINFARFHGEKDITIYTFFSLAELSVQNSSFASMIENLGLNILRCYRSGKGYNIIFKSKDDQMMIKLVDAQVLTASPSLRSLVSIFAPDIQNPKEYLESLGVKHDENLINNLQPDELMHYNYLDCKSLYVAVKNFKEYMNQISQKLFGFEINTNVETLGGFARQILQKLDHEFDLEIYKKFKENKITIDSTLGDLLLHARQFYRGGGLIINYTPLMSRVKFVSGGMYDVVSLYPLSGILSSYFVSGFKDAKFVKSVNRYIDSAEHAGFVNAQIEMYHRELPIVGFRLKNEESNDDDEKYEIFYTQFVPRQWYSLHELRYLLKNGYRMIGDAYGFIWKIKNEYSPTREYFTKLLKSRQITDNEVERLLIKYLLNIAYGKLVQHDITPITNPIFGAYLTSISRLIMMVLVDRTRPYHVATDSIITHTKFDQDSILNEILDFLQLDRPEGYNTFMKNEYSGKWFIYKCKTYTSLDDDHSKMAHHAIRLRSKSTLTEFFDRIMHSRTNYAFKFSRINWYGFDKIKHLVDLKTAKMLVNFQILNDISNLQNLLFKPYIEQQIHVLSTDFTFPLDDFGWTNHTISKTRIFPTVDVARRYKTQIQRTRTRIQQNIRNTLNGGQYKKMRLNPPFDMYNDGFKLVDLDD